MFKTVLLSGFCTALLGQVPQPTIRPANQSPRDSSIPAVEQKQESADALAEAYRRQLDRMTDAERKRLSDLRNGSAAPAANSLLPATSSGSTVTPVTSRPSPAAPAQTGAGGISDLDRSLADLDAIRDRYIHQAGTGACAPTIMMRMADLKWKLAQKGVTVSAPFGGAAEGDYVAIGTDWFKAGTDAPGLELRSATIDDILPQTMVAARAASSSATGGEDVNKMRGEFDALAAACGAQRRQTERKDQ